MARRRLMIIGMGYASTRPTIATKQQIAEYLSGLCKDFDITWICQEIKQQGYGSSVPKSVQTVVSKDHFKDINLVKIVQHAKPDLIFISFNALMKLSARTIISIILRRTKLVMYVGTDYLFDLKEGPYYNFKLLIKKIKTKLIMPHLSSIICRGSKLTLDYKNNHCTTYKTIPIISKPSPHRIRRFNKPYILFIGNLDYSKGYQSLIEAFRNSAVQAEVRLLCVGPKQQEASDIDYQDVIHVGRINDSNEIYDYLHYAHLLIVPSRRSSGEGVPRVIDEAILANTPRVLSTPLPGIMAEHGHKISYTSSYEINGTDLRRAFFEQPREREVHWQNPSRQHADIIKSCLR